MKLLIFSDNHRDRDTLDFIISHYKDLDRIISLGDSEMREEELSQRNIFGVKGNYPFEPNFPEDLIFFFDEWKFFFTHGHKYGVKNGLSRLYEIARQNEIDIVCFGHTHRAILEEIDDYIFLNPGSLTFPKGFSGSTYAIVQTSVQKVHFEIKDSSNHQTLISLDKRRR